jgi:predicted metal-dependent phosphoesterase TrpH
MEVSARGAHILAFDINEPIKSDLGIAETVDEIHAQGGIAIIAHPYSIFRTWVNLGEIFEARFDCVEVANAYQFPYDMMLKKNKHLAEKLNLPITGGSDAHIPRTVGRAYTILEANERTADGIYLALRKGDTEARGRGISLSERFKLVKN